MGVHTWANKVSDKQPTIKEVREYHLGFWEKLDENLSNEKLMDLGVHPDEYAERLKLKSIVIKELNKPKLDSVYMTFEHNDKDLFFSKVTNKWYESVKFNIVFRITEYDVPYHIINPYESFNKFIKLYGKTMWSDYQFKHNINGGIKKHQREMMPLWKENVKDFFSKYPDGLIKFG